jgi:hypothetical protein
VLTTVLLDEIMPRCPGVERHRSRVHADASTVYRGLIRRSMLRAIRRQAERRDQPADCHRP